MSSWTRTPHLVALIAEAEQLASRLATATPGGEHAALWEEAAVASCQLDGSSIPGAVSWEGTLRSASTLEDAPDEQIWGTEVAGVLDAIGADDLGERLFTAPVDALADLHRRLTAGLVGQADAGRPRQTEQAVHDGSVGRILWFTPDPAAVPGQLHELGGWLTSAAAREHGLVVSGILHLEVLRIHPFEAANGRLARTAARLALRARGLDPHGLAVAEIPLAEDSLGIHEEVARTIRRDDQTIWLERWGEAVTAGMRHAIAELGLDRPAVPDRTQPVFEAHPEEFNLMEYRAAVGAEPEQARADLVELLDAGAIARVPGSRGLKFRVALR